MSSNTPNPTLYLKNLNDKVKKEELRTQLYALFSSYGNILDIVAQRGLKMKGQAFVVFRDLASATSAMRGLDGEQFYDKKLHIEYAQKQSHATLRMIDPNFVSPAFSAVGSTSTAAFAKMNNGMSKVTVSQAENEQRKRSRGDTGSNRMDEDGEGGNERERKKGKEDADADDMDMDEDEEDDAGGEVNEAPNQRPPSAVLFCQNLPVEVTDDVLGVLFQQYPGFSTTAVSQPNPTTKSKTANVRYDNPDQAAAAREALDGFMIKRGWKMKVDFA